MRTGQGLWAGMICGTVVQTLVLSVVTMKCEWEKEVTLLEYFSHAFVSIFPWLVKVVYSLFYTMIYRQRKLKST
jgi:hypothetical protein